MARVNLCDRCGAIIKDSVIKRIGFGLNPGRMLVYEVCDRCYSELETFMKVGEGRYSNDLGKRDTST